MAHADAGLCVPGCRYQRLYEGSQTSLADMAANQARAVSDHQHLRQAMILLMKRYFPKEFAQAERQLSRRMHDVGDDILVAYLDQLLVTSTALGEPAEPVIPGAAVLRTALLAAGFPVSENADMASWAAVVEDRTARKAHPTDSVVPVAGTVPKTVSVPEPEEDDAAADLAALFDDFLTGGDRSDGAQVFDGTDSDPFAGLGETTGDPFDELGGLDDLFADLPASSNAPANTQGTPAHATADGGDLGSDLDDLFGPLEQAAPHRPQAPVATEAAAPEAVPHGSATPGRTPEPAAGDTDGTEPARQPAKQPSRQPDAVALTIPLRPELLPTRRRTGRKTVKTKAERPVPGADVPELEAAGEITDDVRRALLAAVAIPRPVFIADLSAIAGSREAVEDWEVEMREMKAQSPVRFIGGKPRHRMRGSLVLPRGHLRDAAKEFGAHWWTQALDMYQGAKLYELAVLLHRVGEEIIAADFDNHVGLLHVNDRRGLIGLAVVTDGELGGGTPGRERLVQAVEKLCTERLAMVGVLSVNSEWEAAITQIIVEEARSRQWAPLAPVVFANSWEWADDAGSTAKLLLGG